MICCRYIVLFFCLYGLILPSHALEGYVIDSEGKVIKTRDKQCLHSATWDGSTLVFDCDGVEDRDQDGVLDPKDDCLNTPLGQLVDANGCDFDQDQDSIVDSLDQCPQTPVQTVVDINGCTLK